MKGITNDNEVKAATESLYRDVINKTSNAASSPVNKTQRKQQPYYLHKCGHGMKADLTAITKLVQDPVLLK